MTDDPTLPVPVKPLTHTQLAALAKEIAIDIRELDEILKDFHLTEANFIELSTNPSFRTMLDSALVEWNKAESTEQRIQFQAATALEDALPTLAARMSDKTETLTAAVDTAKLFAKLAKVDTDKTQFAAGEKFTININLGEDKKLTFVKDVTPQVPAIAEEVSNEQP